MLNLRSNSKLLFGILLATALMAPPPCSRAESDRSALLKEWPKGPVRYLITKTELKAFAALTDDVQRLGFIRQFWNRRDPNPRTPENEARLVFWQRVTEANKQFHTGGTPGWKTDRGKIYILLGPPNDVEQNPYYEHQVKTNEGTGLLRWRYNGLEARTGNSNMVIAFLPSGADDWRLTTDPQLNSVFFNPSTSMISPYGMSNLMVMAMDGLIYNGGPLSTAMDLGRLQEIPNEAELLKAVIQAESFLGTFDGTVVVHPVFSFKGEHMLALTLAIPKASLNPPWDGSAGSLAGRFTASASLQPVGHPEVPAFEIPEEAFVPEPNPLPNDPWLRFQAVRPLPPTAAGAGWSLSAVVGDRTGSGLATIRQAINPPPIAPQGPAFSGPILATQLINDPQPEAAGKILPFREGDLLVVPRIKNELRTDEPFHLYLRLDPPPGSASPVALEWNFERTPPDAAQPESWGPIGHLDDARGPRAWNLAPGALPPGKYTVHFRAQTAGGQPEERSLTFTVLPPKSVPAPAPAPVPAK